MHVFEVPLYVPIQLLTCPRDRFALQIRHQSRSCNLSVIHAFLPSPHGPNPEQTENDFMTLIIIKIYIYKASVVQCPRPKH